jgi:hypothetical protein
MAAALSQQHAADYGSINFQAMDETVLRAWMQEFTKRNIGANDPAIMDAIAKFRTERQALLNAASTKFNTSIADETAWTTLITNNPQESINLALDFTNAVLDSYIDIVSIRTAGVAGKINDAARFVL